MFFSLFVQKKKSSFLGSNKFTEAVPALMCIRCFLHRVQFLRKKFVKSFKVLHDNELITIYCQKVLKIKAGRETHVYSH